MKWTEEPWPGFTDKFHHILTCVAHTCTTNQCSSKHRTCWTTKNLFGIFNQLLQPVSLSKRNLQPSYQLNKQSVILTEYETILDNVLSNMHQLQHGKCQESHNQKNWKKRRVLFERWSPDALTLKTSDYTVSIIKFALTANLVKTRVMGHFGSPAGSRMNQYLLSFLIMIHNWWVINKNKPTLDLGIPFSFSFFFIKSLI